ncbi:MAG: hypothetical protein KIB09_03510 [Firmicutes bacterium]|nr:hypothetical protein [Bacillota bacterium]
MKIRCSRCGKRFDADVYSGLCPKCGAYNGKHMAGYEEAVNEREKTEKTWRQEQQKAEQAVSESRSRTDIPEKPKAAKQTAIKQKAGAEGAWKMLAAALLIPIAAALVFQIWKNIYFQERISAAENIVRESGDAEITVIEGENMEYPVYTAVLGMEQFASDEVPEGWHLEGICIASSSSGYNSKEKVNDLQLGYEVGDEVFYQKTVSRYDLEYMIDDWGIDANEILSEFDFDYGESLGYLIFMVRDGAENRELILELDDGISGSVSRQVSIALDDVEWFVPESGVEE